jgi:hypothetical protein
VHLKALDGVAGEPVPAEPSAVGGLTNTIRGRAPATREGGRGGDGAEIDDVQFLLRTVMDLDRRTSCCCA